MHKAENNVVFLTYGRNRLEVMHDPKSCLPLAVYDALIQHRTGPQLDCVLIRNDGEQTEWYGLADEGLECWSFPGYRLVLHEDAECLRVTLIHSIVDFQEFRTGYVAPLAYNIVQKDRHYMATERLQVLH
jgi:hypothetical protein